jgi:1-acyl-sn-glycerol-3-phosphate acyltransferase
MPVPFIAIAMSTATNHQPAKDRPTFTVVLRPEADVDDPIRALRALLETALRKFGLRAIEAHEDKETQS